MGYCAHPASGVLGWGRGRLRASGWGRGAGFGRGFDFGRGNYGPAYPDDRARLVGPEEERATLRDEARAMEEELKRIQARIDALEA